MVEILEYVLGGFWRFLGFIIILSILVKGLVLLTAVILNRDIKTEE